MKDLYKIYLIVGTITVIAGFTWIFAERHESKENWTFEDCREELKKHGIKEHEHHHFSDLKCRPKE
ncbi:hypothetical protein AVO42_00515 [Thiomicrospira sp. XS5]|uniref:hypothetical protein n=1 Tax=Thiomicrospira sp. XS5 TaxID=1775636 RepID=UPI000748A073|nr:hypothetical protein [Thiomicrospira sp. XS5]KUJ73939.1 hypothetical protein AVO42_00515 [Thiomicrospira sp. XS5]